jgi:hypothetical protein
VRVTHKANASIGKHDSLSERPMLESHLPTNSSLLPHLMKRPDVMLAVWQFHPASCFKSLSFCWLERLTVSMSTFLASCCSLILTGPSFALERLGKTSVMQPTRLSTKPWIVRNTKSGKFYRSLMSLASHASTALTGVLWDFLDL